MEEFRDVSIVKLNRLSEVKKQIQCGLQWCSLPHNTRTRQLKNDLTNLSKLRQE